MAEVVIANSSFLAFTSYGTYSFDPASPTDPAVAYGLRNPREAGADDGVNVAIVLPRANDPTPLLESDWGTRQQTLAALKDDNALAKTYGADEATYDATVAWLTANGYTVIGDKDGSDGYVSSAESRTIWVSLDAAQFQSLFGTPLMEGGFPSLGSNGVTTYDDGYYWQGNLSLPDAIAGNVVGLWPDMGVDPAVQSQTSASQPLPEGSQSIGNAAGEAAPNLFPQDIAALYNFPLQAPGSDLATGTVALVEATIGAAVEGEAAGTFQQRLDAYRAAAGIDTSGAYYAVANNGSYYWADGGGERSLDVSVVTTVVPGSTIGLYAGSGFEGYAQGSEFTAYQAAIWDKANTPAVISSSWSDGSLPAPDSPFYVAYHELFVDAALNNVSVFNDAFDGGSGNEVASGLAGQFTDSMSPYVMVVGGTSIATPTVAAADPTLAAMVAQAQAGDPETLWRLVRGGLTQWPSDPDTQAVLVEAVWNQYYVHQDQSIDPGYFDNYTTGGGVDTTQPTPWYQQALGFDLVSANPGGGTGRGVPDVSALAGGDMYYYAAGNDMTGLYGSGGTSAATPLWASLATQMNAVFADQGLPDLGYANDLYYIAAAVAPASFNDVSQGSNTSSFVLGGAYSADGNPITPTGFGYASAYGYDLTTGLGSPNGVLLARALTTIAHAELYYDLTPVVAPGGSDGVVSGADQSLLFQVTSAGVAASNAPVAGPVDWSLSTDAGTVSFTGVTSDTYAWTAALAQQSVQADFSPQLLELFDHQSQGMLYQTSLADGEGIGLTIDGAAALPWQVGLTADFGFASFVSADGAVVEVARPVAVATTAGAADDQDAVVRVRQLGENKSSVMFYQVDDLDGAINGIHPGDPFYGLAARLRAYHLEAGGVRLNGPGYGQYEEAQITGVDAGDYVAMSIRSRGHTYYAFSDANERVGGGHVGHIWSYGLNTWGWEDGFRGGDQDYNDLIVQLDFTSTSGTGILV